MSEAFKKITEYEQKILKDLLGQCTQEQQEHFVRMYPEGVTNLPTNTIRIAIRQCEATIKKNQHQQQGEITDVMIERAKEYPMSQLIAITNDMAYCINHAESDRSMNCKDNYAYCHVCGWKGDVIDVKMKLDNLSFTDAVKSLQ